MAPPEPRSGEPPERLRVLLVEDDPRDVQRLKDLLAASRAPRFDVTPVDRVEEALRILRDEPHDVVLLDLTLAETEGLDTLGRARVAAATVPFVVMAPESDEELAVRALRLGAQDYLAKGESSARILVRTLRHAVERHRMLDELRVAREREHFLATHDTLTGLPNRFAFRDHLRRALDFAARNARHVAILFLDLDRFKGINDSVGHPVGDALLKVAAERLLTVVRRSDLVARLGGDEFVVLLSGVHREYAPAKVAAKILDVLSRPYRIDGDEYWVTASIGIAMFPRDATDPDVLVRDADTAMYQAKRLGPNRYHFYAERMNAVAAERLAFEGDLREAIERGAFELHYQPQVDVGLGTLVGAEALVRWRHPLRGLVPPASFIPLAEETGLIQPIGDWVLRHACAAAAAWPRWEHTDLRVAVNVSTRQIDQGGFADRVWEILRDTGLEPHRLELELTESSVMEERGVTLANVTLLRRRGVRVSIDDFGTGFSSLAALRRLPVDGLKIDRSFVQDIPHDAAESATARGLVEIARGRSLAVVAEGVETQEQLDFLFAQRCHLMQGYLFAKPMPQGDFVALLRAGPDAWRESVPEPRY